LVLAAGTGSAAVIAACLPSLAANQCGNGHIDPGEQCDPGGSPDPGCTSNCLIACPYDSLGDGGRAFVDNPVSNHCYFTADIQASYDDANYACQGPLGAHLVTFVGQDEVKDVVSNLSAAWSKNGRFWVGFQQTDPSKTYPRYATNVSDEPGWATPTVSMKTVTYPCSGCYLYQYDPAVIPPLDAGPDAGADKSIVATDLDPSASVVAKMAQMGPKAMAQVVCEREPRGSRSGPCGGGEAFCFTVMAEVTKHYVYNPNPATADEAEGYCRRFTDAGTGMLVVFESRAEREQIIYELSQLRRVRGYPDPPTSFWIGLTGELVGPDGGVLQAGAMADGGTTDAGASDAGTVIWVWDDTIKASLYSWEERPSVWGNLEPAVSPTVGIPLRAFVLLDDSYDTGLAHVRHQDPERQTSAPFVCQY
jgi:hypothetical protein